MNNVLGKSISMLDIVTLIIVALVMITLYGTGVYLHTKIIKMSKIEKSITWKLDITHSILIISLYGLHILVHYTTYMVQDLYLYTGTWFCYSAKVIATLSNLYVASHSMIISLMK